MRYLALAAALLLAACSDSSTAPQLAAAGNYVLVDSLDGSGHWVPATDGQLTISSDHTYLWRLGAAIYSWQWSNEAITRQNRSGEYMLLEGTENYFNWFVVDANGYAWLNSGAALPSGSTIVAAAGGPQSGTQYAFSKR